MKNTKTSPAEALGRKVFVRRYGFVLLLVTHGSQPFPDNLRRDAERFRDLNAHFCTKTPRM